MLSTCLWLVVATVLGSAAVDCFHHHRKFDWTSAVLQHPFPRILLGLCPNPEHFWNLPVFYYIRSKFLHGTSGPSATCPHLWHVLSTFISHGPPVCSLLSEWDHLPHCSTDMPCLTEAVLDNQVSGAVAEAVSFEPEDFRVSQLVGILSVNVQWTNIILSCLECPVALQIVSILKVPFSTELSLTSLGLCFFTLNFNIHPSI